MGQAPLKRAATYEDLLKVPDGVIAEIIDGDLIASPRPTLKHAGAATALSDELGPPFRRGRGGPGGWIILFEPELHVVGQILVPDLAGWRRERMPELPDTPFAELPADWVCEVLSLATAAVDRTRKMHHYARAGVRHVWLIDPGPRTLEIYRLDGEGWGLTAAFAGDDKVHAEPFDAIELDLTNVWAG
jgi:Uma2 family endonuclease